MLRATCLNCTRSCSSSCSRAGTGMAEGTNFSRLDARSKRAQSVPFPKKTESCTARTVCCSRLLAEVRDSKSSACDTANLPI